MLITKNARDYSRKKKYIIGRGFVDALSNAFNSLKASAVPALRGIGSYVSNNKDLIAKPRPTRCGWFISCYRFDCWCSYRDKPYHE